MKTLTSPTKLYEAILTKWENDRLLERQKAQSENYPQVCIMGDLTFINFLSALRSKYGGLLEVSKEEAYLHGLEYQGVKIYWSCGMDRGCIFGGTSPY